MVDSSENTASRVRRALRDAKISVESYAGACGVSKQAIYKAFKNGQLSLDNIIAASAITGISIDYLVGLKSRKQADGVVDFSKLMEVATPRSVEALNSIEKALETGKLTEEDLALLRSIAERFLKDH